MNKAASAVETDAEILAELERLGAAFPWQSVSIWVERAPEGELSFSATVEPREELGVGRVWGSDRGLGSSAVAVDNVIRSAPTQGPAEARDAKVKELEEQIRKLRAVQIGDPPYRPGTRLAARNGAAAKATVDVTAWPTEAQQAELHRAESRAEQDGVPY